jgi:hypothetical protein
MLTFVHASQAARMQVSWKIKAMRAVYSQEVNRIMKSKKSGARTNDSY